MALDQRGDARAEATTAAAQRLGAQALSDASLDRGMLLARQGVALDDSVQTRGNLLATLLKSPAAIGVIGGDGAPLASLDLSRDGRTLALLDNDGTLARVDPATRRRQAPRRGIPGFLGGPIGVDVVRFSDDGSLLAVAGAQPVVIDAATGRTVASLPTSDSRYVVSVRVLGGPAVADRHDRQPVGGVHDDPALRRRERPADRRAAAPSPARARP